MHSSTSVGTMASDHSGSSAMILRMLRVSAAGLSLSLSVGDGTCTETIAIQQTSHSCKTSNAFGDLLLSDLAMKTTSYSRQKSPHTYCILIHTYTRSQNKKIKNSAKNNVNQTNSLKTLCCSFAYLGSYRKIGILSQYRYIN